MRAVPRFRFAASLCLLVLTACKVGPDYKPPEIKMPDAWTEEMRNGAVQGPTELANWWRHFNDPVLTDLIQRADNGNLELKVALARIKESRHLLGIAKAEWFPAVDGTGSGEYTKPSENGVFGPIAGDGTDIWSLGFDATWELDVFGRIARNVESQNAALGSQYENYRDIRVILFAEVARNYMTMRAFQQRLEFANKNVETQQGSLKLAQDRLKAGVAPELDVAQAQSNLGNSEQLIPILEQGRVAAMLRIAVLLGVHPGEVRAALKEVADIPKVDQDLAVGLPADIIRQRPDIRSAERQLASQTAQIGVATADLYPRFSLSGFFALESTSLSSLFDGNSVTWGIGLPVRWALFRGGQIRANIGAAEARTEAALKTYEQTVLLAIEDIEGSINRMTTEKDRAAALERAVAAAERSVTLSLELYRQGLADFQRVLDAQRELLSFQDLLAESRGFVAASVVSLYKALGGGWDSQPEQMAKEAAGEEEKKKSA
ncbi:MAG: efflux transporter outer membrane subunit [Planctomycetota bacterium]|jgi:NodT family efflux transporter outer membrane factor (OMF) lipoprotein